MCLLKALFFGIISMNFFRKLLIVTLTILSMVSSSRAMHMHSSSIDVRTIPLFLPCAIQHAIPDHKAIIFPIYKNLKLIENCPVLPLDVVNIISFDAYVLSIVSEFSESLIRFRRHPQEVLTLIKSLHNRCGFNVSVLVLKKSLMQAKISSLADIKDFNMNLIECACYDENNVDCINIIFAVAGDKVYTLISANDVFSGMMTPFHRAARDGHINIVKTMLDACSDRVQDLIDLKNVLECTALDILRYMRNDPLLSHNYFKLDEVITLLKSYQCTNQ